MARSMKGIQHLKHFEKGFLNLPEDVQQELFYLSLYDPSGWEEEVEFDYLEESEIRNSILEILEREEFGKLAGSISHSSPTEKESLIKGFFYSGHATNRLLKSLFEDCSVSCSVQSSEQIFDVQLYVKGTPRLCIGIKRFLTGSNVYSEYKRHIEKIEDHSDEIDHLFILFYPLGKDEEYNRVRKMVMGYQYILEDLFQEKYDYNFTFSCLVIPIPKKFEVNPTLNDVTKACLGALG